MHRLVILVLLLLVAPGCGGGDSNPVDPDPPIPTIQPPTPTPMTPVDPDACKVGQTLSPGERCKVGSAWFSITDDGHGLFTDAGVNLTIGEGITIGTFRARHLGNGRWIIEAI